MGRGSDREPRDRTGGFWSRGQTIACVAQFGDDERIVACRRLLGRVALRLPMK